MYTIFCDGASKQNPGESGVGIIINKEGNTISKIGEYIGKHTNNVAEYISVIRALTELIELSKSDLNVLTSKIVLATDSLLVIKQLNQEEINQEEINQEKINQENK